MKRPELPRPAGRRLARHAPAAGPQLLLTVLIGLTLALVGGGVIPARAATFTVTSTGDTPDALQADGVCDDGTGACTLRAAMQQANFSPGTDTITFNIPGTGVHTIQPLSALPAIVDPVFIDGFSQPGASVNNAPLSGGSDAVIKIELDGSVAGSGASGLDITTGLSTVRGLAINRFAGDGFLLDGVNSTGNVVAGNYIGTDASGTSALGNGGHGVFVNGGVSNTIGGTTPAGRNVLSGNSGAGVRVDNANALANLVEGNLIGTSASGSNAIGNSVHGVSIFAGQSTTVGGPAAGAGNVISGNASNGVQITANVVNTVVQGNLIGTTADGTAPLGNAVDGVGVAIQSSSSETPTIGGTVAGAGNRIAYNGRDGVGGLGARANVRRNSIYLNGGLGINVSGPPAPLLASAISSNGSTTVAGTYRGPSNSSFDLEFFTNDVCDPSAYGEGRTFIGVSSIVTDNGGNADFSETFAVTTDNQFITATATDSTSSTSGFSACLPVDGRELDSDGDGYTDVSESGAPLCLGNVNDDNQDDSSVNDGCPAVGGSEGGAQCLNNTDDDADGYVNDGCPVAGALSEAQFNIGTNKFGRCGVGSQPNPSPSWPSDFVSGGIPNSTDKITITDLTSFIAPAASRHMGTSPGDPNFSSRWDVKPGRGAFSQWINVQDLTSLIAGPTGYPPMFNGAKAFGFPLACTPHPVYGD